MGHAFRASAAASQDQMTTVELSAPESFSQPRAVIADASRLVRDGLERLLKPHITILASVGSARELCGAVACHGPGIIIMDLDLPDVAGFDALRELRRSPSCGRIVVLSTVDAWETAMLALLLGAAAFVPKQRSSTTLVRAISESLRGRSFLALSRASSRNSIREQVLGLSDRQRAILRPALRGMRSRGIAQELGLSCRTVESHRAVIMQIFGVHSMGIASKNDTALRTSNQGRV